MELVAFDLDGTLLNKHQRLSEYTIETLERLKSAGVFYTVATGRTHFAAMPCIQGHDFPNWQIFKNGVEWWNPESSQYRHRSLLSQSHIVDLLSSFEENEVTPFIFCLEDDGSHRVFHAPLNGHMSDHIANELGNHKHMSLHPLAELSHNARITNISAMGNPGLINNIIQESHKHEHLTAYSGGGIYNPDAYWLDIHHSNVCKGSALKELKDEIGAERMLVFGDGDNDLSMFSTADEAFATENASLHVKEAATNVIGHHDEDGVARYLRKRYDL
ncbi:haloacid dehalogenase [Marinomonas ushuaiensis DSM 15871]|uniref:Haloacid dehalogenase n=1 Tax=Marinomonas ushuaiensis DSM 15871 TaxID=1122207 RepID=X7E9Y8_9GAMM|nr:HAD family hydrolase [Marinomonas ushuaiensis]ETX11918.1 haloacid dehalogenase [Marinomonas ushuaiensis DSM 15871]